MVEAGGSSCWGRRLRRHRPRLHHPPLPPPTAPPPPVCGRDGGGGGKLLLGRRLGRHRPRLHHPWFTRRLHVRRPMGRDGGGGGNLLFWGAAFGGTGPASTIPAHPPTAPPAARLRPGWWSRGEPLVWGAAFGGTGPASTIPAHPPPSRPARWAGWLRRKTSCLGRGEGARHRGTLPLAHGVVPGGRARKDDDAGARVADESRRDEARRPSRRRRAPTTAPAIPRAALVDTVRDLLEYWVASQEDRGDIATATKRISTQGRHPSDPNDRERAPRPDRPARARAPSRRAVETGTRPPPR